MAHMCARYHQHKPRDIIQLLFDLGGATDPPAEGQRRFNISPTDAGDVVFVDPESGARRLSPMRWGWRRPFTRRPLINAATDPRGSVKPMFRKALAQGRCLVPATGFYEWKTEGKVKQPHHIGLADGGVLAMGGLWERGYDDEGGLETRYTILTTAPNPLVAALHDRMPVILPPVAWSQWLERAPLPDHLLAEAVRPAPADLMATWPVDRMVSRGEEDPRCVEPIAALPEPPEA